jgi:hypothetical protein
MDSKVFLSPSFYELLLMDYRKAKRSVIEGMVATRKLLYKMYITISDDDE